MAKYEYPKNVLTVSMVFWIVEKGISIRIDKKHVSHCRQLASQKMHKKTLFGSGFLISNEAAAEKAAAEKDNIIIWELSDKEKQIIKNIGLLANT